MGFDAEIDNSERNSVVENLKSEVQCSICCSIFEDPVKLDCCDGHLCKKCYENVKKQFQNCPLCRQANFTAKFSRLMVTVLSQYKLFCPAAECNESVPYANFANHIKSCPALNKKPCPHCKKLYWKNDFIDHFACFEELNKTAQEDKKKVIDMEWKVSELESKLGPITQSRDAHAKNNTTYKTKIRQLEENQAVDRQKIKELEQNMAADKIKIQNQRSALSGLHKKADEYNVLEKQLEHFTSVHMQLRTRLAEAERQSKISQDQKTNEDKVLERRLENLKMANTGLTRKLAEADWQSKKSIDKVKSSEMTISRLRSTINRMNNEPNSHPSEELILANQEIQRLRHRNWELNEELNSQPKKSSGFFGLFKK